MSRKRRKKEVKPSIQPSMEWGKNGEARIKAEIGGTAGQRRAREPEKVKTVTVRGMEQVRGVAKRDLLAAMPGGKRKLASARQGEKRFAEALRRMKRGIAKGILKNQQCFDVIIGASVMYGTAGKNKFYREKSEGELEDGRIMNSEPVPPPPHK